MSAKKKYGLSNQQEDKLSKGMKDLVLMEVTMVLAIDVTNGEDNEWLCAMDYVEISQGAQLVGFSEERLEIVPVKTKEKQ